MRRRGRFGGLSAAVGDVARSLRRARAARGERVRVYDAAGHGTTVDPASIEGKAALEGANQLLKGVIDMRKLRENGGAER